MYIFNISFAIRTTCKEHCIKFAWLLTYKLLKTYINQKTLNI